MSTTQPPAHHHVQSLDERLDEALDETFPASDPIAVDPEGEPAEIAAAPVEPRDQGKTRRPNTKGVLPPAQH
jgi:hypothetical protein